MGNFNAGAIEANLILGRSDWTRDLKKTQAEIAKLEGQTIQVALDLDADNFYVGMSNAELFLEDLDGKTYSPVLDIAIKDLEESIAQIEASVEALDDKQVMIRVDADVDNALVQLGLVEDQIDRLELDDVVVSVDVNSEDATWELMAFQDMVAAVDAQGINVDVDVDSEDAVWELMELEAMLGLVDGKTINIDVDYDEDAMDALVGGGGGGGGHLGLLRIAIYAIIALSPVLGVAIGAMVAGIVALSGAIVAALGPIAVLAAGLTGLVQRFKDAKDAGEPLSGPMQAFADSLDALNEAWNGFLDQIEDDGFGIMAQAVNLLASVLPSLAPLFDATAEMISKVLVSMQEWIGSDEFDEMIDFFSGFGVDMLRKFIEIGGNLIQFFGRLFDAMAPFTREMMRGLEEITAGWAEWADDLENNTAFQQFLDNAATYGPMVLDMLGSLLNMFMALGEALQPFAGPMLQGLTFLFDTIANLPTDVLTGIIAGLAGLWLGFNVLAPLIGAIITGIGTLGTILGVLFSPIGLLVIAIAGFVAVLIHLWRTNEDFRNAIIDSWNAIISAVEPVVRDIVTLIRDNWGPIKEWVQAIWADIQSYFTDAFIIISEIVKFGTGAVRVLWDTFGDDIVRIIKGVFQIIGGSARGFFQMLKGVFQVIRGVLTGDWRKAWEGIKNIGQGFMRTIEGLVKGFGNILAGVFGAIKSNISRIWGSIWGGMRNAWSSFSGWISNQINKFVGMFGTIGGKIADKVSGAFNSIGTGFANAVNAVIRWWNGLEIGIPPKDWPGPGSFPGISISTPDISEFATGAYVTNPTLAWVGEGPDNEVVAPEPVLERIVREQSSGTEIDYGRLAKAIATALAPIVSAISGRGITADEIMEILASAAPNIMVDARSDHEAAGRLAKAIGFEMRRLGYGGVS